MTASHATCAGGEGGRGGGGGGRRHLTKQGMPHLQHVLPGGLRLLGWASKGIGHHCHLLLLLLLALLLLQQQGLQAPLVLVQHHGLQRIAGAGPWRPPRACQGRSLQQLLLLQAARVLGRAQAGHIEQVPAGKGQDGCAVMSRLWHKLPCWAGWGALGGSGGRPGGHVTEARFAAAHVHQTGPRRRDAAQARAAVADLHVTVVSGGRVASKNQTV